MKKKMKKIKSADVEKYVGMPHTYKVIPQDDGTIAARCNELPGCFVVVEKPQDLHKVFLRAKRLWIETALKEGLDIPVPEKEEE